MVTINYHTKEAKLSRLVQTILGRVSKETFPDEEVTFKRVAEPDEWTLCLGTAGGFKSLSPAQILTKPNAATLLGSHLRQIRHRTHTVEIDYEVIDTFPRYFKALEDIAQQEIVAVDIETGGNIKEMYPWEMPMLSIQVATWDNVYVFPQDFVADKSRTLYDLVETIQPVPEIVGANFQFDSSALFRKTGIHLDVTFDTFYAHYSLNQNAQGSHSLLDVAQEYLGAPDWEADKRKHTKGGAFFENIPPYLLWKYGANDVYWSLRLKPILEKELEKKNKTEVYEMLLEFSAFYQRVQRNGFHVDMRYISKLESELSTEIADMKSLFGTVNPGSPKQVIGFLDTLGVSLKSSDKQSITKALREDIPDQAREWMETLQEYRKKSKGKSAFVDSVLKWQRDGIVYPSVNVCGTVTGRMSSSNPNIHQQPRDPRYRSMWKASSSKNVIVACDYSQAELRVLASISKDPWLSEKLNSDEDFFDAIIFDMFDKSEHDRIKDQPKEYRNKLKAVIYGLLFGRGAAAIAEDLRIPEQDAQDMLDTFLENASALNTWRGQIMDAVTDPTLKIESPLGREFVNEVVTDFTKKSLHRSALSMIPQSTASDICILAAMSIERDVFERFDSRIVATVHDSIIQDTPKKYAKECADYTVAAMERMGAKIMGDLVPFKADWEYGPSWGKPTRKMK